MSARAARSSGVYLGLGSNDGDREHNLTQALLLLREQARVLRVAGLYETEPVGVDGVQPWFLNTVAEVQTELAPSALLAFIKQIERRMGRRHSSRGPRPIDIDILLWGSQVINLPDLLIPHPRMHERPFVLDPLADLASRRRHPVLKKSVAYLKRAVRRQHAVRRVEWSSPPLATAC